MEEEFNQTELEADLESFGLPGDSPPESGGDGWAQQGAEAAETMEASVEKPLEPDQEDEGSEGLEDSPSEAGYDAEAASAEHDQSDENAPAEGASKPSGDARLEYYASLEARAKAEVQKIAGEEYDEFDPKHQLIFSDVAQQLRQADQQATKSQQAQEKAVSAIAEALGSYANNEEDVQSLAAAVRDLPYSKYMSIQNAALSGDPRPMIAAIKEVATGRKASRKARTTKIDPPAMFGAGAASPTSGGSDEGDDPFDGFDFGP